MRVFLTGCNGYLGGWVIEKLEASKHIVYGEDSHGSMYYYKEKKRWEKEGAHESGLPGASCAILMGWYSSVGNAHPSLQIESQERTLQILDRLIAYPKVSIIFISSAAVYGNYGATVVDESVEPNPNCAYSKAKYRVEQYIQEQPQLKDRTVILRLGSLMGMGCNGFRTKSELIVNAFALDAFKQKKIVCWNPENYKPIIHVEDAASVIVKATTGLFASEIYNVAEGSYQAQYLAESISKQILGKPVIQYIDKPDVVQKSCIMDCTKLRKVIDFKRKFKTYDKTVKEFVNYSDSPDSKNTPWIQAKELL